MYSLREAASFHIPGTYILDVANTSQGLISLSSDHRLSLLRHDLGSVVKSVETGHGVMGVVGDGVVCTAGEQGSVSVWDMRAGGKVAGFQGRFKCSGTRMRTRADMKWDGSLQVVAVDAPIISLACDASTQSIAVGTELHEHSASIVIWYVKPTCFYSSDMYL